MKKVQDINMNCSLNLDKKKINIDGIDYSLRSKGEGGNGEVYEIVDFKNNKYVLKVLKAEEQKKDALSRFKREVETLEKVEKKGIKAPRVLYSEEDEEAYYIMDKYVTFKEKFETIKNWDTENKIEKCLNFLNLIKSLHENDIYHRDIKDENILIDENDNFILCDFGIVLDTQKDGLTLANTPACQRVPAYIIDHYEGLKEDKPYVIDIYLAVMIIWEIFNCKKWEKDNKIRVMKDYDELCIDFNCKISESFLGGYNYNSLNNLFKVNIIDNPFLIKPIDAVIAELKNCGSNIDSSIAFYHNQFNRLETEVNKLTDTSLMIDGRYYNFEEYDIGWQEERITLAKRNSHSLLGDGEEDFLEEVYETQLVKVEIVKEEVKDVELYINFYGYKKDKSKLRITITGKYTDMHGG